MNHDELMQQIKQLAARAPQAPQADHIHEAIALRQTRRRQLRASAGIMAVVLLCLSPLLLNRASSNEVMHPTEATETAVMLPDDTTMVARRIDTLPNGADMITVQSALESLLETYQILGPINIDKQAGQPASVIWSSRLGEPIVQAEEFLLDLNLLMEDLPSTEISADQGEIRLMMIRRPLTLHTPKHHPSSSKKMNDNLRKELL